MIQISIQNNKNSEQKKNSKEKKRESYFSIQNNIMLMNPKHQKQRKMCRSTHRVMKDN